MDAFILLFYLVSYFFIFQSCKNIFFFLFLDCNSILYLFIYLFYLCTNIIVMKNCTFVLRLQMLKKKKGPLVNKRNVRPNSEKTAALAPFQLC